MPRRRFTEKDVLRTLLHTGHTLTCFRSKQPITLENVDAVEREHITPVALGGADGPENCGYSIGEKHREQTFGKGATTAFSDIGKIAKAKRIERTQKFVVNKPALKAAAPSPAGFAEPPQETIATEDARALGAVTSQSRSRFPKGRKMQSRPFPKISKPMRQRQQVQEEKR